MPETWICHKGHRWQPTPDAATGPAPTGPGRCPVCGSSQALQVTATGPARPEEPASASLDDASNSLDETLTPSQMKFSPGTAPLPPSSPARPALPNASPPPAEDDYLEDETLQRPAAPGGVWPSNAQPPAPALPAAEDSDLQENTEIVSQPSPPASPPAGEEDVQDTLHKPRPPGGKQTGRFARRPDTAAPEVEDGTLQRPAGERPTKPIPRTPGPGRPILGGYEVLQELGRGGMGVVYKARQVRLNRLVALKMVLSGNHASPQDLARFQLEAEAVAELQHPNIVQVYEVGEHQGLPFLSMEFVDGGSLQQQLRGQPWPHGEVARLMETLARAVFCAHQKGIIHRDLKPANILLARPAEPVTLPARGPAPAPGTAAERRLIEEEKTDIISPAAGKQKQVPRAEERTEVKRSKPAAQTHIALVPHTGAASQASALRLAWVPKITDFGLAKRLDQDTGYTATGDIVGTPQYMAPEQAEGRNQDLGMGTDIYALGAILYDLLTGRPPFRGKTLMDTLQQVVSSPPVPPARVQPGVPRDLETICLKCLEKEPRRRYSTAEALADDLRRYLDGRPIAARPTPLWERGWKWARRSPVAAALILVCLAAVLALAGGGYVWAQREQELRGQAEDQTKIARAQKREADKQTQIARAQKREADKQTQIARAQKREADKQFERAEENFRQALAAVDTLLTRAGQGSLAYQPRLSQVRRELLEDALAFYEKFLRDRGPDEALQWEAARAYQRVGTIQRQLGRYAPARKAYQSARELLLDLTRRTANAPRYQVALAETHAGLGDVLAALNETATARLEVDQAVTLLAELHHQAPADREYQLQLGKAYNHLGTMLTLEGTAPVRTEQTFRQAVTLLDKLAEATGRVAAQEEQARAHANLAALLIGTRRDEAEQHLQTAQTIREQLIKLFPEVPSYRMDLGQTYLNLGQLWLQHRSWVRAGQAFAAAERILKPLTEQFVEETDFRHLLALTYTNRAVLFKEQKDFDSADQQRDLAQKELLLLVQRARANVSFRQLLAQNYDDQGISLTQHALWPQAQKAFAAALALQKELVQADPKKAAYQMDLARCLLDQGALARASKDAALEETSFREAVDALEQIGRSFTPPPPGWLAAALMAHKYRALYLFRTKQAQASEKHWARTVELSEQQAAAHRQDPNAWAQVADYRSVLAQLLHKRGADAEASACYEKAVASQQQALVLAPANPKFREGLGRLVLDWLDTLVQLKDHARASRIAADLAPKLPANSQVQQKLTGLLARCIVLAQSDGGLSKEKQAELAQHYGDQALAALRQAIAHGYRDVQALQTAAAFDPLRNRREFQQLVQELEGKK